MDVTKRNSFIDFARRLPIYLFIIGHLIQFSTALNSEVSFLSNKLFIVIYAFHMPFFMLVSGYLFFYTEQRRTVKQILTNRVKQLLIPVSIWTFLLLVSDIFAGRSNFTFIGFFVNYIQILPRFYWFIFSILASTVIALIAVRYLKSLWFKLLFFLLILLIPDVSILKYIKFMFPYFIIGYYYNKYELNVSKQMLKITLVAVVIFITQLVFWKYEDYIYTSGAAFVKNGSIGWHQIYIDLFRWLIGLSGSITVLVIINYFYKIFSFKLFVNCGKLSLGIYLIHLFIIHNLPLADIFPVNTTLYYLSLLGVSMAFLLVSYGITSLINKNIFLKRYLLGS